MKLNNAKIFFISIQLVLIPVLNSLPQTTFETKLHVTTWADDKQSAFSFSFDDGFLSHFQNAGPILQQYGFKATFNVMPPFLTENLPGIWRYGTWPMFIQLSGLGHEIASHTLNHPYLTSLSAGDTLTEGTILHELYQSKKIIEQRLQGKKCLTLAYPYSDRNSYIDSLTSLFYEAGRSAAIEPNDFSLDYFYDLNSYVVHFDLPRNNLSDDLDELYDFMNWVHNSIINNQWAIMMLHEIVPQSELPDLVNQGLYEPVSNEWFIYLCDWLQSRSGANEIWIETTANVIRYMKQRDNYNYQILSSTVDQIKINIYDDLDNNIYNYPLSVKISVPDSWDYVLCHQSGRIDSLSAFATDSGMVVLGRIIPDGGIVTLTKLNVTSINNDPSTQLTFRLYQNYPNPFNPSTTISYQLPVAGWTSLKVFDILGNEIAVLTDEYQQAGTYELEFNSANLPSGTYFYRISSGDFRSAGKMLLLK